ncbi:PIG-L deacetylase family protein [Arthrobacter sp. AD-310]
MTFSHADAGTSEADWAASGLPAAPVLALDAAGPHTVRLVVLAAHPDDETLGAGGLVASLLAAGAEVDVILCTAGEGSHPASPTHSPAQLASIRLEEFAAALAALGLGPEHWHFLALPDRGLDGHASAITDAIRKAIRRLPVPPGRVVLVAPYRADGHADHDALGAVAAEIARQGGHGLLEYPIWYWHWARPASPDWQDWVRYPLDPAARATKARAMAAHATQIRPLWCCWAKASCSISPAAMRCSPGPRPGRTGRMPTAALMPNAFSTASTAGTTTPGTTPPAGMSGGSGP